MQRQYVAWSAESKRWAALLEVKGQAEPRTVGLFAHRSAAEAALSKVAWGPELGVKSELKPDSSPQPTGAAKPKPARRRIEATQRSDVAARAPYTSSASARGQKRERASSAVDKPPTPAERIRTPGVAAMAALAAMQAIEAIPHEVKPHLVANGHAVKAVKAVKAVSTVNTTTPTAAAAAAAPTAAAATDSPVAAAAAAATDSPVAAAAAAETLSPTRPSQWLSMTKGWVVGQLAGLTGRGGPTEPAAKSPPAASVGDKRPASPCASPRPSQKPCVDTSEKPAAGAASATTQAADWVSP